MYIKPVVNRFVTVGPMNKRRQVDAEYAQLIERMKSGADGLAKGRDRSREVARGFARERIAARIAEHDSLVLPYLRE